MSYPLGWNVTEPLHIAKKIYDFIQAFRDASDEVKAFTSHISMLCSTLELLKDCLENPAFALNHDLTKYKATYDSFSNCVGKCQRFIKQFQRGVDFRW